MKAIPVLAVLAMALPASLPASDVPAVRFQDSFEGDLSGWEIAGPHVVRVRDSSDGEHGRVLELQPNGAVWALVRGSGDWGGLRVEADFYFPDDSSNYLGFVYNFTRRGARSDFGEIYVKGDGSYLRVNPWRDGNVGRLLYEEYKTPLVGEDAIHIRQWHHFKAEVLGRVCHVYIGDMATPKLTFPLLELSSGLVGFKPRVVGTPVWIDNVTVSSIDRLTYDGPGRAEIVYEPKSLLTDWEVIGPLPAPVAEIEWSSDPGAREVVVGGVSYAWRPFEVDPRGAVITGTITEYTGNRPVAYFRTILQAESAKDVVIHFSTVDELDVWVNGEAYGFVYRDGYVSGENDWNAWYDFWKNPKHTGRRVGYSLRAGANQVVVRVRNGQFASGGFFAHLEDAERVAQ